MKIKKKLDILIISRIYSSEFGGGLATHVGYLAEALHKMTLTSMSKPKICKVHVFTTSEKEGKQKEQDEGKPPNLIIHLFPGKAGHFPSLGDVPSEEVVKYGFDNWGKIKPDVIHAHDFESVLICLMFKTAFKVPLVVTIHRTPKEWDPTLPQRDLKDCFLKAMLDFNIVDKFIAPSDAYKRSLLERNCPKKKIEKIPHGIPVGKLIKSPNVPNVLQRLNIEKTQELILCPSRLDPHKSIETFIDAAALVKKALPNRNIVFAVAGGSGPACYRKKLEQQVQNLSMETVIRLGPSNSEDLHPTEMPTLYRQAKICVLPSQREGFGQALLEAFVHKKPVIASNTGGIPEVVIPNVTGLLFNRNEAHDLAFQIKTLLEDEDNKLAFGLAEEAYKQLTRKYDVTIMAQRYFELYKKVAGIAIK